MAFRDTWHRTLVYFGLAVEDEYEDEWEGEDEAEAEAEYFFGKRRLPTGQSR